MVPYSVNLKSTNWAGRLQVKKLTGDLEAALTAMTKTQKDIQASVWGPCFGALHGNFGPCARGLWSSSMGVRGAWVGSSGLRLRAAQPSRACIHGACGCVYEERKEGLLPIARGLPQGASHQPGVDHAQCITHWNPSATSSTTAYNFPCGLQLLVTSPVAHNCRTSWPRRWPRPRSSRRTSRLPRRRAAPPIRNCRCAGMGHCGEGQAHWCRITHACARRVVHAGLCQSRKAGDWW